MDHGVVQLLGLDIFEPIFGIHLTIFEENRKRLEIVDMFFSADRDWCSAELTKR